jgi:hypothetical protein
VASLNVSAMSGRSGVVSEGGATSVFLDGECIAEAGEEEMGVCADLAVRLCR